MNKRLLITATALTASALLLGCGLEASRPPLDATWGLSVRMAVQNQKLDPALGGDRPVTGQDGVFAKNALDAYRKSSEPDPQTGRLKDQRSDAILTVKESKQ